MSLSKPMSVHTKGVRCVAIRENLIVSGSDDGMLYRWSALSGESMGSSKLVEFYLRSAYINLF